METKEIYAETVRHFLEPVLPLLDDPSVTEILINGHQDHLFRARRPTEPLGAELCQPGPVDGGGTKHRRVHRPLDRRRQPQHGRPPARWFAGARHRAAQLAEWLLHFHPQVQEVDVQPVVAGKVGQHVRRGQGVSQPGRAAAQEHGHRRRHRAAGKPRCSTPCRPKFPKTSGSSSSRTAPSCSSISRTRCTWKPSRQRPDGTGRVTIRDLFVDSLRMRPDRIVVGEIRRGEALDLVQSMISGHAGSLTTVHATTAYDAAIRLETLSMMSDVALPGARGPHASRLGNSVGGANQPVSSTAREKSGRSASASASTKTATIAFQDLYRFEARGTRCRRPAARRASADRRRAHVRRRSGPDGLSKPRETNDQAIPCVSHRRQFASRSRRRTHRWWDKTLLGRGVIRHGATCSPRLGMNSGVGELYFLHLASYGCAAPTFGRGCIRMKAAPMRPKVGATPRLGSFARFAKRAFGQNPLALGDLWGFAWGVFLGFRCKWLWRLGFSFARFSEISHSDRAKF